MSLEDIVGRILDDARAVAGQTLDGAARQAAELRAAGENEARARAEVAIAAAAAEIESEKNNRLAGVRLAARASVLALKRDLVDEVFAEVGLGLRRRPPEDYAAFLASLVPAEAAREAATVVVGGEDLARAGSSFPGLLAAALSRLHPGWHAAVSPEPGDFPAGLQVRTDRSLYDLSLETLLAERRGQWEVSVAGVLFSP